MDLAGAQAKSHLVRTYPSRWRVAHHLVGDERAPDGKRPANRIRILVIRLIVAWCSEQVAAPSSNRPAVVVFT